MDLDAIPNIWITKGDSIMFDQGRVGSNDAWPLLVR